MTGMKLYEISSAYRTIEAMLDDESVNEAQLLQAIEDVDGALQDKATSVVKFIENLCTVALAKREAAKRMTDQAKAIENRVDHIKAYVLRCMQGAAINKISCPEFTISVRNNPARVVVTEESAVPLSYFKQPEVPAPVLDKKKIADDIRSGCIIEGVHLEESQRIEIR